MLTSSENFAGRANRSNLSSTLYDFMRDGENEPEINMMNGNNGTVNYINSSSTSQINFNS